MTKVNRWTQTISKNNIEELNQAVEDLEKIVQLTKKYPGTIEMLENVKNHLGVLRVFYAAHCGKKLDPAGKDRFPYNAKEWTRVRSDARTIYTYARQPKAKKDPAGPLWEVPSKVLDLAVDRARWMEGLEI